MLVSANLIKVFPESRSLLFSQSCLHLLVCADPVQAASLSPCLSFLVRSWQMEVSLWRSVEGERFAERYYANKDRWHCFRQIRIQAIP